MEEIYLRIPVYNINKLYVACTRAVDGLYIFSKSIKKVTENSTNLNAILQKFTSEFPYSYGSITNKNSENIAIGDLNNNSKNNCYHA